MNQTAIFAGGCFWCIEAVMQRLRGVLQVESGYTGGEVVNPTYEQVCSGKTGHVEAVKVVFDPSVISYANLVDVFLAMHDPTSMDKQGADIGSQYRSVIFYTSPEQMKIATSKVQKISGAVTQILSEVPFYSAEKYHQGYYNLNRQDNMYCRVVIDPKIHKLMKDYSGFVDQK